MVPALCVILFSGLYQRLEERGGMGNEQDGLDYRKGNNESSQLREAIE